MNSPVRMRIAPLGGSASPTIVLHPTTVAIQTAVVLYVASPDSSRHAVTDLDRSSPFLRRGLSSRPTSSVLIRRHPLPVVTSLMTSDHRVSEQTAQPCRVFKVSPEVAKRGERVHAVDLARLPWSVNFAQVVGSGQPADTVDHRHDEL